MKYLDEYRNPMTAKLLAEKILRRCGRTIRLMEFCGGHTVAIMKHGLRQLLSPRVELLSGPGCPVCVTANRDLDKAIALARHPDVILTTFGDMLRVPGSRTSLQKVRAEGGDVRIVYSATDAVEIARNHPEKSVVFLGIGFETTAPTIASSMREAQENNIANYYVHSLHKLCPPVMKALLDSGETKLDGILCPGHVSAVIGSHPYEFIPRDYGVACAIAGFEPLDILLAVEMLVEQIESQRPAVEIAYRRGVKAEGNRTAQEVLESVFETDAAKWRGIGVIPASGLTIREKYQNMDAERMFSPAIDPPVEQKGCICGDILRGVRTPYDCSLYGTHCTPEQPIGPCMVSSEGACAAYYLYGAYDGR
ncbi:MAG: hydrogenase formation protein HypD [Deltaproteobacteria bacterium]|nr:hydrogenase formation protein HypD [Deltaproteobacteria bacterium]